MALTDRAHDLITRHFYSAPTPLNLAIDATCGNGHDTAFLAGLGFNKVMGFDIQARAIELTRQRLADAGFTNVQLLQQSHEHLAKHLSEPVDCIMFNLGYLPNASKSITTAADTSLIALKGALKLLSRNGLLSLMCYPGHPAGAQESKIIETWLATLGDSWSVDTHLSISPTATAPILYLIHRSGT